MGNRGQNMFARASRPQRLSWKGWPVRAVMVCFAALTAVSGIGADSRRTTEQEKKMTVGAYYFDGWAGRNSSAGNAGEPWLETLLRC